MQDFLTVYSLDGTVIKIGNGKDSNCLQDLRHKANKFKHKTHEQVSQQDESKPIADCLAPQAGGSDADTHVDASTPNIAKSKDKKEDQPYQYKSSVC